MWIPFEAMLDASLMPALVLEERADFTLPSFTFSYMTGEDETRCYTVGYDIDYMVFALRSEARYTLSGEGIRNAFGEAFGEAWGDLRSRLGKKFDDLKNSWFGGCRAGSKVKCPLSTGNSVKKVQRLKRAGVTPEGIEALGRASREGVIPALSKADDPLLERAGKYWDEAKSALNKDIFDASAGCDQVHKIVKKGHPSFPDIEVGGKKFEGIVAIREGTTKGGLQHMRARNHIQDLINQYLPPGSTEEKVKEFLAKKLGKKGWIPDPQDPLAFTMEMRDKKPLRIVFARDYPGTLQDAYPQSP